MANSMMREDDRVGSPIKVSNEPAGPKRGSDKGSMGDRALMDALVIVGAAWLIVFGLMFSLRHHNV